MRGRRGKTEGERVGPDQGSQDLEFCPDKGMGRLPLFKTDICSAAGLRPGNHSCFCHPRPYSKPRLGQPFRRHSPAAIQREQVVTVCFRSLSRVPLFCDPMGCSLPGSSVHGISQQEYWSGLPLPSLGDLPKPGIEPPSPVSCISRRALYHHATREAQLRFNCP